MSTSIFLSYRRSDAQAWASHLSDALERTFGVEPLFFDLDSIGPGDDFIEAIQTAVASASIILAVIGPSWLTVAHPDGRRRLDDPEDVVRLELAAALAGTARVIPVLVGGAVMPSASSLPADLMGLARRQALELTDKRWDYDYGLLADTIEKETGAPRIASKSGGQELEGAIAVGTGVELEHVEAGDIAGVKANTLPPAAGGRPIDVLRGATIKNSKLGDIVGIKLGGDSSDSKS